MRTKVIMTICLFLLMVGKASAQWSVIDPTNIAQSIINSSNNIVHTSSTAQNIINNIVHILIKGGELLDDICSLCFGRLAFEGAASIRSASFRKN